MNHTHLVKKLIDTDNTMVAFVLELSCVSAMSCTKTQRLRLWGGWVRSAFYRRGGVNSDKTSSASISVNSKVRLETEFPPRGQSLMHFYNKTCQIEQQDFIIPKYICFQQK